MNTYIIDKYKELVNIVYKNKYKYLLTNFKNLNSIITITCPEHGVFKQNARNHLNGEGCDQCTFQIINELIDEIDINNINNTLTNDEIIYSL